MVTLFVGLLAALGAAGARPTDRVGDRVVSLAFDRSADALVKATGAALYRSADGGRHWVRMTLPRDVTGSSIAAVAIDAQRKGVLYLAGPGIGVLRSADGGRSWTGRTKGLPSKEVLALAAHADRPDTIYAYVAARGIFRSEDGGTRWQLTDEGPRESIHRLIHSNMPGSMQTGWFFAATPKGVSRSMDCFCGWRDAGTLGRAVKAVAYDPRQPQHVYAATDDGLFVSTNGGEQWARANAPAASIAALVGTPSGALYAVAADGAVFRTRDLAKTWERVDV